MQLFVEQLTVIDSSYIDPKHGLVGESWLCDVTLHGALDGQSMVMDFGDVKKKLKQAIDLSVDHKLLIPKKMQGLSHSEDGWQWKDGQGGDWHYQGPPMAECVLDEPAITDEVLAAYLEAYLMGVVPQNVQAIDVRLYHETPDEPYYHYSHGLKKHEGNCQRIAHGHRSKVKVWHNGQKSAFLEQEIADMLNYHYLVSQEDIVAQSDMTVTTQYEVRQGPFRLSGPLLSFHMMQSDSTVECIAQHLAQTLQHKHGGEVTVRAYEGAYKGALFTVC